MKKEDEIIAILALNDKNYVSRTELEEETNNV